MRHPDWAAAYILSDWKQRGRKSVQAVYDVTQILEMRRGEQPENTEYVRLSEKMVKEHIDEAIRKLEVYIQALKDARNKSE